MIFDQAFNRLIGFEGNYSNNPKDAGGETKFGISKRSFPGEDIPNLTLERAKAIYLRHYWLAAGCESVPAAIRYDLFDMAVTSSVMEAVKTIQHAVGADEAGIIGPNTLARLQTLSTAVIAARFNGARLMFMTELGGWSSFNRGWARRIASNLMEAQ